MSRYFAANVQDNNHWLWQNEGGSGLAVGLPSREEICCYDSSSNVSRRPVPGARYLRLATGIHRIDSQAVPFLM